MKQLLSLTLFLCILCGCQTQRGTHTDTPLAADSIRYARGLDIQHFAGYTAVEVKDPWDSTQLLQRYILVGRDHPLPADLPAGTVVRVPIRNVAVYTAVHAGIIDLLGETGRIVGVCEPRFIDLPAIQEGIRTGKIADLGEATSPNVEKMIEAGAEVVIVSPFENNSYGPVEKTGIPLVEGADYMEALPLGRTEWIRFFGLLFDKAAVADSIFAATEQRYLALKELVAGVSRRPTVISEKRFGSTWYVPAGDSYVAHLFRDAGADYLFADLPGSGSRPYPFEKVFEKAIHADFWLVKYNQAEDMTRNDLRKEYAPYEHFDAFKNGTIYGCNTGVAPYYEECPLHPDYLLKDLARIFHPTLLPDYTLRYYNRME